jgi:type VI secretion system secreted protein VgrG
MPAATGPALTQTGRPLAVTTPLGKDALLLVGLAGSEGLSQLYQYTLSVLAPVTADVPFDKLVGQPVGVRIALPKGKVRFLHGVCVRVEQGDGGHHFVGYRLDVVPKLWLLSKRTQSRIFQHVTVPDILKKVLDGLDVRWELRGKYEPRNYCVQYRETDLNFASRLMEEEGIYYFFDHKEGAHTMVVADTPASHPVVPGQNPVTFKTVSHVGVQDEEFVHDLSKVQEQTSGKFTLWDHTFELPHEHLTADKPITDAVAVGGVTHKLKVGDNGQLEVYDGQGEYAQRFDGIDKGGGERPQDLKKIYEDNKRTVELRMQATAAGAVSVRGGGSARQLAAGHRFKLVTLPADPVAVPLKADGEYVLTTVAHSASLGAENRSGSAADYRHDVRFTAIPAGLPFRPRRAAAKPVIPGTQTAQVVGPPGEEIFTDKYGRIKVQFHWDREGKRNADSSCWVRVAQPSAGNGWGLVTIPRVGQEAVIAFLEGDPDRPICVGCVYNPKQMPQHKLPDEKTKTYFQSNSSPGGVGYNALRFEDKAGQEQVYLHAQRNMDTRVRNDSLERVGKDRHLRVGFLLPNDHKGDAGGESKAGNQYEEVAVDQHLKVHRHREEHVGGNVKLLVGGGDGPGNFDAHIKQHKKELIDGTSDLHVKQPAKELFDATLDQHVKGKRTESVDGGYDLSVKGDHNAKVGSLSLTVDGSYQEKAGQKHAVDAGQEIHLKAGMTAVIEATTITLKGAGGFITISPAGVAIQGVMVLINSGGAAVPGTGSMPTAPQAAKDAADAADANPTKPKDADLSKTGAKSNN